MSYNLPIQVGHFLNPTIADPAAGADFLFLLPNNRRYQLVSLNFNLVTDATVANRNVLLDINQGSTLKARFIPTVVQPGSQTHAYQYLISAESQIQLPGNGHLIAIPNHLYIPGNFNFTTSIINLQAGDQITDIEFIFNTWIERTV